MTFSLASYRNRLWVDIPKLQAYKSWTTFINTAC